MNIYYVTEAIMNDWSAPSVHVNEICKNMAKAGCKVTLYLPKTRTFSSVNEYRTVPIQAPHFFHSLFYQPLLFFRLWRDISADRPDMLYSRHSHLLLVPTVIGKLFKIPVILEVNEQLKTDAKFNHDILSYLFRSFRIFDLIESINFRLASKLITVTIGIKEDIIKTYRIASGKIIAIANGVDDEFFKPIPPSLNPIKTDPHLIYIGYIGSFLAWQGLRYVVEAARLICMKRMNIKFVMVGGGTDGEYLSSFVLKNKLEGRIEIHPPIPHEFVPAYINTFDVCISYPIKLRGGITSPFKVYEYLACGKPVISADIAGMQQEFGEIITYVEPESPEALVAGLIPLLENQEKRQTLGKLSRKFIVEGHSWKIVTQKILSVCEATIKKTA